MPWEPELLLRQVLCRLSHRRDGGWIAYDQAVAAYAPGMGVIGGNLAREIDRPQDTMVFFFKGFGPASSVALAAFANATFEAPSRIAYTALALALTMILKRCRLSDRTMQKVDRLGSKESEQPDEGSGHGSNHSIDSEVGASEVRHRLGGR
jgi:hypothetical protein